jgi:uncharacterized protein (TIGR03663 family)
MTRSLTLVVILLAGAALVLRWPGLDRRPMHNDEGVNAVKFGELWEHKGYKYDPNEHHGPSLFYATLALERLTGAPDLDHFTDGRLRAVPVLFGLALIPLLLLLVDGIGRQGIAWAAFFTAVSPAMVFYSSYFIHEMLLVCFTFLALGAGWRYWRTRKLGWMLLAGAGVGLMASTKETFVITLAAAAIAVLINQAWNRQLDASGPPARAPALNIWHIIAGLATCCVVALILFSSFFSNPSGPIDAVRTYLPWAHRAAGQSPHVHPWYFYLQRLLFFRAGSGPFWTEALVFFLALVGAAAGFRRHKLGGANASLVRFLALYTFLLAAFYTLLAYKTPWCLLSFWHGAVLLAGVGAAVVVHSANKRAARLVVIGLFLLGGAHLAWEAWRGQTTHAADPRNPYVYAQTSPDVMNLVTQVEGLAQADPRAHQLTIKVIAPDQDYWPLPWYLRRFKTVGWWERVPEDPFAPIMIVSAQLHAALDDKKTHLMVGYFQLRPQVFMELYVQLDLWKEWLAQTATAPSQAKVDTAPNR